MYARRMFPENERTRRLASVDLSFPLQSLVHSTAPPLRFSPPPYPHDLNPYPLRPHHWMTKRGRGRSSDEEKHQATRPPNEPDEALEVSGSLRETSAEHQARVFGECAFCDTLELMI